MYNRWIQLGLWCSSHGCNFKISYVIKVSGVRSTQFCVYQYIAHQIIILVLGLQGECRTSLLLSLNSKLVIVVKFQSNTKYFFQTRAFQYMNTLWLNVLILYAMDSLSSVCTVVWSLSSCLLRQQYKICEFQLTVSYLYGFDICHIYACRWPTT